MHHVQQYVFLDYHTLRHHRSSRTSSYILVAPLSWHRSVLFTSRTACLFLHRCNTSAPCASDRQTTYLGCNELVTTLAPPATPFADLDLPLLARLSSQATACLPPCRCLLTILKTLSSWTASPAGAIKVLRNCKSSSAAMRNLDRPHTCDELFMLIRHQLTLRHRSQPSIALPVKPL